MASFLYTTFMLKVLLSSSMICFAFPGFNFGWGNAGGGGEGSFGGDPSFGGSGGEPSFGGSGGGPSFGGSGGEPSFGGSGGDPSFGGSQGYPSLFPEFYSFSCPQANDIVMSVLENVIAKEPRMAASLLRLHFHDCFVQVSIYVTIFHDTLCYISC